MTLLNANKAVLSRVAFRMAAGKADDAEDCLQDTAVSAYKAYMEGKFNDDHRFRPWILTILTNAYLSSQRKKNRMIPSPNIQAMIESRQSSIEPGPDSDDTLGSDLQEALDRLPERIRACVVLVDVEGMEYQEAASALHIPVGTVRSRMNRARLKLASDLIQIRAQRGQK